MRLPKLLTTVILIAAIHSPAWSGELENGIKALEAQHYSEALNILLPLANSGNAEAQRLIGEMSFNGQGMKKNTTAAFKWNELSAASGNATAQFNLGYLYEHGEGVQKSNINALEWYTKAALQDYVPAERKLGDLYATTDRDKAIYWYDKARIAGDKAAYEGFSKLFASRRKERDAKDELDKTREEEKRQEWEQWQAERRARDLAADNSPSIPARSPTPFQGLDSINKVMRDGQRTIAAAQADRARQQQWQKEAEAPRRDRQPTAPQQVAQADSSSSPSKHQVEPVQVEPQRVAQADATKVAVATTSQGSSTKQPQQPALDAGPKKSTSKNTGKNAMQCVSVTQNKDDVEFHNTCDKQIFVVWCGDLKYAKEKCGDGPKGNSYYTHSNNIMPGKSVSTSVAGQYRYAACEGGIAFGKDEIQDRPDGSFTCIPE